MLEIIDNLGYLFNGECLCFLFILDTVNSFSTRTKSYLSCTYPVPGVMPGTHSRSPINICWKKYKCFSISPLFRPSGVSFLYSNPIGIYQAYIMCQVLVLCLAYWVHIKYVILWNIFYSLYLIISLTINSKKSLLQTEQWWSKRGKVVVNKSICIYSQIISIFYFMLEI